MKRVTNGELSFWLRNRVADQLTENPRENLSGFWRLGPVLAKSYARRNGSESADRALGERTCRVVVPTPGRNLSSSLFRSPHKLTTAWRFGSIGTFVKRRAHRRRLTYRNCRGRSTSRIGGSAPTLVARS